MPCRAPNLDLTLHFTIGLALIFEKCSRDVRPPPGPINGRALLEKQVKLLARSLCVYGPQHLLDVHDSPTTFWIIMPILLDLLSPYPILENLVSSLNIGDLFNLSKVNSAYRIALHGFGQPCFDETTPIVKRCIRPTLYIGRYRTAFWENLKSRSQLRCSEPHHIKGSLPTGCLICSAPVCEACIIKAAFAKRNETTFQKRHRPLCSQCWSTGNRHKKHRIQFEDVKTPRTAYADQAADGDVCICTAKTGHLCLNCKNEQNAEAFNRPESCYGQDCPNGDPESKSTFIEGRVCLWCSRQLPGSRSRAESRRDYDARYLHARAFSSYDRALEDKDFDFL